MVATRDEKGRFVKGHPDQGAGRKPRATEDDFLALLDDAVTAQDWIEIINKAKSQAKKGDAIARAWLTDRRFGKVKQPIDQNNSGSVKIVVEYADPDIETD